MIKTNENSSLSMEKKKESLKYSIQGGWESSKQEFNLGDKPPTGRLTFLKHQQSDTGRPAHYVRGVLGVTGEGAVVIELQVFEQDGSVTATWVSHKLQSVSKGTLVVNVGSTTSVVEDLQRTVNTLSL